MEREVLNVTKTKSQSCPQKNNPPSSMHMIKYNVVIVSTSLTFNILLMSSWWFLNVVFLKETTFLLWNLRVK